MLTSALRRKAKPEPKKDVWDRAATLTVPFVTLVLGLLGAYVTASHNDTVLKQQELQAKDQRLLGEMQQMRDLYPYIASNDAQERLFAYEMYAALGRKDMALKLIDVRQDRAGVPLLKRLERDQDLSVSRAAKQSLNALGLVSKFESFTPSAIGDPNSSFQTVGYGHAITADERAAGKIVVGNETISLSEPMSEASALKLLRQDMQPAYATVDRLVTVSITRNQRDALASFVFNVGPRQFAGSAALQRLNLGDHAGAKEALRLWNNGKGRRWPNLAKRREAEIALWDQPDGANP